MRILLAGSANPSTTTAAITDKPATHSQVRRWPKRRDKNGMRTRSTSGAQIHLKLYTSNASANAEMDLFWMPASERRLVSVAASIAKGNPEDTPRKKAASGADSKYGRAPRGKRLRQDRVEVSVFILVH